MRRFSLKGLLAGGNDFLALRLATLDALLDMPRILNPQTVGEDLGADYELYGAL
jgi:hypothetical protein